MMFLSTKALRSVTSVLLFLFTPLLALQAAPDPKAPFTPTPTPTPTPVACEGCSDGGLSTHTYDQACGNCLRSDEVFGDDPPDYSDPYVNCRGSEEDETCPSNNPKCPRIVVNPLPCQPAACCTIPVTLTYSEINCEIVYNDGPPYLCQCNATVFYYITSRCASN